MYPHSRSGPGERSDAIIQGTVAPKAGTVQRPRFGTGEQVRPFAGAQDASMQGIVHMCYSRSMSTIGVRELRQNAREVLRAVEAGEPATVTVAGRAVAQIVAIRGATWRTWHQAQDVFASPTDPGWDAERWVLGAVGLRDPWAR